VTPSPNPHPYPCLKVDGAQIWTLRRHDAERTCTSGAGGWTSLGGGFPTSTNTATECYVDIEATFAHTASSATVAFFGQLDETIPNESWAFSNVEITAIGAAAPAAAPLTRTSTVFGSSGSARNADFDFGCATRSASCPEGRDIGAMYFSSAAGGATFHDTVNVYVNTQAASGTFGACNGPHSGWGNAPMTVTFETAQAKIGFYYTGGDSSDMAVTVFDSTDTVIGTYAITDKTNAPASGKVSAACRVQHQPLQDC
jgi:hypothetical protein